MVVSLNARLESNNEEEKSPSTLDAQVLRCRPTWWGDAKPYRGSSLIRNSLPLGPYSRTMPRALWWSYSKGGCSYE
jgi:hypothetical protein